MKKYLVVGLGITGLSVVEYLAAQGADIVITDTRDEPPNLRIVKEKYPNIPLLLGNISVPGDITDIVLSPGITIQSDLPTYGDIELFARVVDKPVIAITGSNGKSTVTTILGEMAKASGLRAGVGGNLGTPALQLLNPKNDIYILELSSFQLETTHSLAPEVATILNLSPDHLDRYGEMSAYHAAKMRIFANAKSSVINAEDPFSKTDIPGLTFGLAQGDYRVRDGYLVKDQQRLMPVDDLAILGKHNVANALATLAIGDLAGFKLEPMLEILRTFPGLEHRCEYVTKENDVLWINDSKGTNPGATIAALEGLSDTITGKWVVILGGVGKDADFSDLVPLLQKYCKAAILIGTEQQNFWDLLHEKLPCYRARELGEVVTQAKQIAVPGDGVLFSPACASFDMFDDYKHRGRTFKQHAASITTD